MNPAIEYVLRDDKIRNMLSLPSSIFINKDDGNKLIITIHASNGYEFIKVNHWKLWEIENKFPVNDEFTVDIEDLFTSPSICLKNCTLLEYEEDPYESGKAQSTDMITGMQQQSEYEKPFLNFFNSMKHRKNRFKWLWNAFESHLPEDIMNHLLAEDKEMLRELIKCNYRGWWFSWTKWMRIFLESKQVSSELVFKSCFPENKKIWTFYTPSFVSF